MKAAAAEGRMWSSGRSSGVSQAASVSNLENSIADLRAKQENLDCDLADARDAQAHLEKSLQEESQRVADLSAQVVNYTKRSQELADEAARQHADELGSVRQEQAQDLSETRLRMSTVEKELQRLSKELKETRSAMQSQQDSHSALDEGIQRAITTAEHKATEVQHHCMDALTVHAATADTELKSAIGPLMGRCEVLQGDLDSIAASLQEEREQMKATQVTYSDEVTAKLSAMQKELDAQLQSSLERIEAASAAHAEEVDRITQKQLRIMTSTLKVAENVHTRSIVWQARNFKKRLSELLHGEDQTIRSPGFSLSSLPEMQLEIQMAAQDEVAENVQFGPSSLPLPGSCSVGLWGPAGLRVVFMLTMGEGAGAVSRRFEHTFPEESDRKDHANRSLLLVKNFCRLNQVWARREDSIRVAFDLLEWEVPISPLRSLADEAQGETVPQDAAPEEREGGEDAETLPEASPEASPEEEGASGENEEEVANRPATPEEADMTQKVPLVDSLLVSRLATAQELVKERLSSELQALRNRSVRRIEWRVADAKRLLDSRVGEALDSPPFSAAGLERIQLHLYPRDTTSTGSASQPCALYVSGPSKTFIKGVLWVGSASRPLEHRFSRRGETAGRSRFCLLDQQIEGNDTVVVALDLTEVEVDLELPSQNASLCLRDAPARPPGAAASPAPSGQPQPPPQAIASPPPSHNGSRGHLRMRRSDPCKTEELVKSVSLPTLNPRQLKMPLVKGGSR